MNVSLIFTTSDKEEFASVLAHCMALGIVPAVSAPEPPRARPAMPAPGESWEAAPAVRAFRALGVGRLRVMGTETLNQAAIRKLRELGEDVSPFSPDWKPENAPGPEAGEMPTVDMETVDGEDL